MLTLKIVEYFLVQANVIVPCFVFMFLSLQADAKSRVLFETASLKIVSRFLRFFGLVIDVNVDDTIYHFTCVNVF